MKSQEMYKKYNFITANGMTQFNNPQVANDVNPYECFDGGIDNDLGIEYSDATGRKSRSRKPRSSSRAKGNKSTFEKVWAYTPLGMAKSGIEKFNSPESVARRDARRKTKTDLKQSEINAQKEMVANIGKGGESDATLLASLSNPNLPSVVGAKPPMSKTTKIVLISSGVVVLGIIAFVMYKKLKK